METKDNPDHVAPVLRGVIVRGTERIASRDALRALGWSDKEHKRLALYMRSHGWSGPHKLHFAGETERSGVLNGYWRQVEGAEDVEGDGVGFHDDLPAELERVTRQGLKRLSTVLSKPIDVDNGSLLRSQVTAAGIAINAQLRADEHQLRRKASGDALARLLKLIEKELPQIKQAYQETGAPAVSVDPLQATEE